MSLLFFAASAAAKNSTPPPKPFEDFGNAPQQRQATISGRRDSNSGRVEMTAAATNATLWNSYPNWTAEQGLSYARSVMRSVGLDLNHKKFKQSSHQMALSL